MINKKQIIIIAVFLLTPFLLLPKEKQKFGNYFIEKDNSGNSYVAGSFNNPSISFGNTTLHNFGKEDIFVAKYKR